MDYLNEGHEKFCRWRDEVVPKQDAKIARLTKRVESLLNMRERTIELLSDSIRMLLDGLDANSPNEDPGREGGLSTDEWEKRVSAARAALGRER